jgi:hypothetical protein
MDPFTRQVLNPRGRNVEKLQLIGEPQDGFAVEGRSEQLAGNL